MTDTLAIFIVALGINFLYELFHSQLYTTCLKAPLPKYAYLLCKGAIFDAFVITGLYLVFGAHLISFILACLTVAYLWEWYSLKVKKWEYAPTMPIVLGVGITPLLQLALTGIFALYITEHFF